MTEDLILKLVIDFFIKLEQLGPGSKADTLRALKLINELPADARIGDIGCGTGYQTMTLAENTTATIAAVDILPELLKSLNDKAENLGYADRISTHVADMCKLPFDREELDLIWAEGSIYNIGFAKGLKRWKKYLKQGGYIAVTEISWLTDSRPDEIQEFWTNNYAEIDTIPKKLKVLKRLGYEVIEAFPLPASSWEQYYLPFSDRITSFLDEQEMSNSAKIFVSNLEEEIDFYQKYKDYYSYVFYVARKI